MSSQIKTLFLKNPCKNLFTLDPRILFSYSLKAGVKIFSAVSVTRVRNSEKLFAFFCIYDHRFTVRDEWESNSTPCE